MVAVKRQAWKTSKVMIHHSCARRMGQERSDQLELV